MSARCGECGEQAELDGAGLLVIRHKVDCPENITHCILCGFRLGHGPTMTTDGLMCSDGMGCRRRALRIIKELSGS